MHDRRVVWVSIILDGVGIGAQPDSYQYGDEGSNTLGHVCQVVAPRLPHLQALGLGCIAPLNGVPPADFPAAQYGKMQEVSAGKDSTTGHWELAGLRLDHPFPTYPDGFPPDLIDRFIHLTGCRSVLGNRHSSGTTIIEQFGAEHERTGYPIVYTSADSVLQIAGHKEIFPLDELYRICEIARNDVCIGEHAIGRVIARPFVGTAGAYERVSSERRDFALPPPDSALQESLQAASVRTVSIGKISDLFGGIGFDEVKKTMSNGQGIDEIIDRLHSVEEPTFIWANLIDFDQEYGHRNDTAGFARALEEFDAAVPDLMDALPEGGILTITADHGNDPTTPGTDHTREFVPLLVYDGRSSGNLGTRSSFCDHAASAAAFFNVAFMTDGQPFGVYS